jgi:phytoene synthase
MVPRAALLTAEEIVRRSGSSFVSSFLFLSPERRRSMRAVYAFCKVVDDAVDVDGGEAEAALAFWRAELGRAYAGRPGTPVGRALAVAAATHGVPEAALLEVVRGVEMDLAGAHYERFEDLVVYCRRVASAVGRACLPVLGASERASGVYADRLGVALQFTNILRDLGPDARAGRVYLPRVDLERFGVPASALAGGGGAPETCLARLLAFEGERARDLFAQADAAIPPSELRALLPARMMGAVYRELLAAVLAAGVAGLARPPARLPRRRKLLAVLRTWLGRDRRA